MFLRFPSSKCLISYRVMPRKGLLRFLSIKKLLASPNAWLKESDEFDPQSDLHSQGRLQIEDGFSDRHLSKIKSMSLVRIRHFKPQFF